MILRSLHARVSGWKEVLQAKKGLAAELGEAGFGGGERFFSFAEGEADLRGAVLCIIVEAGAGHTGYTDFLDKIFCEGYVL